MTMQERNANGATVAPDAVRWVMGPSGTVVTFPAEVGLPSIFEPKSCRYFDADRLTQSSQNMSTKSQVISQA